MSAAWSAGFADRGQTGVRLVAGCRLDLVDGTSLLVWPEDRAGWSRLTRLLTEGKKRADPQKGEKGQCFLHWEDVDAWSDGLVAALVTGDADAATEAALAQTADIFGDRAFSTLTHRRRPGTRVRLHRLDRDGAPLWRPQPRDRRHPL